MTHRLLSLFKSDFLNQNLSVEKRDEYLNNRIFNFLVGDRILLLISYFWLLWILYEYQKLLARPPELYVPLNYMATIFMPSLPKENMVYTIIIISFSLITANLWKSQLFILRGLLVLLLLWLNLLQWGFGFFSNVAHIFLISHLFSVFIPKKLNQGLLQDEKEKYGQMIVWYHLGILITYTFAGFWKLIGLFYKLIFYPDEIHWLHPKGALINAIVSFRYFDYPMGSFFQGYNFPFFWQLSFAIVVLIQCFSFTAAFKSYLQAWLLIVIIIFHFINIIAFNTVFIWQPLVIMAIFLPYDKLVNVKYIDK